MHRARKGERWRAGGTRKLSGLHSADTITTHPTIPATAATIAPPVFAINNPTRRRTRSPSQHHVHRARRPSCAYFTHGCKVDVGHNARCIKVNVRSFQRVVRVRGAVRVRNSVVVRLYVRFEHVPGRAVLAVHVRAERAVAAVLPLGDIVRMVNDVPISSGINVPATEEEYM